MRKVNIRPTRLSDTATMSSLSKIKRLAYEKAQPQFWRYAGEEGDTAQRQWFKGQLEDKNYVMLTAENDTQEMLGFIIGKLTLAPEVYNPDGLTKAAAQRKDASQILVVCGAHDHPKRNFLSEQNLSIASEWFVGGIV